MKKAFTMLELIFVLVVIGILASIIIPNTRTNSLQEAAIQVLSHIRYTQHLALVDDKYDKTDPNWYKARWQIVFHNTVSPNRDVAYTIFSDANTYTGDATVGEIAKNPLTPTKLLSGGYGATIPSTDARMTKKMNLSASYGVTAVTFGRGCNANRGTRLSFDHLGRPFQGRQSSMSSPYNSGSSQRLLLINCAITLYSATDSLIITVRPETGYANITY